MYKVTHYAYCGMVTPRGEFEDRKLAQEKLRRTASFYAKHYGCALVWRGPSNVEICEPENCLLVPDFCGHLELRQSK